MPTTVTLPDDLTEKLRERASTQNQSLDEFVAASLQQFLEDQEDWPSPEEVVARIRATPPDPSAFHPATESLLDYLRATRKSPPENLADWDREWDKIEAEMKSITKANDQTEGRR